MSGRVEKALALLRSDQVLKGQSGRAVTAALYLRYLKRVSAHLKNVATSVVNPFHRIGYKEKGKKDTEFLPTLTPEEAEVFDEMEELEGDESRD